MDLTNRIDVVFGHLLAGALLGLVGGATLGTGGGLLHLVTVMVLGLWAGVALAFAVVLVRCTGTHAYAAKACGTPNPSSLGSARFQKDSSAPTATSPRARRGSPAAF